MTRPNQILTLICTLVAAAFALSGEALANTRQKPNIVLVQVDDMSRALLGSVLRDGKPAMPKMQKLLAGRGTTFRNNYTSTPLCAPSRSALISGQFGRNSGVVGNDGNFGGWPGWIGRPIRETNLATMLQDGGYHTAHFGKFLNHYDRESIWPARLEVPPGWNTWVSDATDESTRAFYGYRQLVRIERDGEIIEGTAEGEMQGPFGNPGYANNRRIDPRSCRVDTPRRGGVKCNYHSDRMTRLAAAEIRGVDQKPLFLQVDYHSPHLDSAPPTGPQPATRHLGLASKIPLPRNPAFNERNTNDKSFLPRQNNGRFSRGRERRIKEVFQTGLESLRSVDDGIRHLVDVLKQENRLGNTYFIFVSDNGFFYGEHRFPWSKFLPYEPSSRVPLVIRGPGVARAEVPDLVNTVDLAPTVLDAAGVAPDYEMDGKSLLSIARGNSRGTRSRALLIESISSSEMKGEELPIIEPTPLSPRRSQGKTPVLRFRALRIGRHKYISYTQGGEELYDLRRDPHELYSQARNRSYRKLLVYMRKMLDQYRDCAGAECLVKPKAPPKPGKFKLDARRPPKRMSTKVAFLYRDAVYARLKCTSKRPCRKAVSVHYRGNRVTERVEVKVAAGGKRRLVIPAIESGIVKLQRASERKARVKLKQVAVPGSGGKKLEVSRPILRQN